MNTYIILSILIFLPALSYTQINTDSIYQQRLFYLCKAWGHAKYYHTEIAAGNVNWDNELLSAIEQVKNATSEEEYNDAVQTMLENTGEMGISTDELPEVPDSLDNNTELDWIYNPIFSDTVSAILDTILQRFRPQTNVYLNGSSFGYFATDDQFYTGPTYPGEDKRLLALFRYWNIIHYFFPYKDIMDQHWNTTLMEFIPRIITASDELSYHLTFKELSTRIDDSHAFFVSPVMAGWNGEHYPPFQVRFIENEMVVTKVRDGITHVQVGDVIREIDGEDIQTLRDSLRKYAHGSNDAYIERMISELILWGDIGYFEMTIDNGTELKTETYFRNNANYSLLISNNGPAWRKDTLGDLCKIGIVDMGVLETGQVADMFDELWDTEAIIFDVRNYPNGTIVDIIDSLFADPLHFVKFTVPYPTNPGRFYWADPVHGDSTSAPYPGEIAILFDERTISHAEFTCMALERFPGAVKIGSQTAGADGNVVSVYVPGKIRTNFTLLGVFYPDYTPTQRIGIVPDLEVHPTIAGIRNSEDEVLDFAMQHLEESMECVTGVVNTNGSEKDILLYPNPVNQLMHYEIPYPLTSGEIIFDIIDIRGRVISSFSRHLQQGTLDLSALDPGMYFVRITTEQGVITKIVSRL